MSKKSKAYLKEETLLTLLSQNNLIIPEIQREYVWGNNPDVLSKFLKDIKKKIGPCCEVCNLPKDNRKINIGFLYSYKPDYVKVEHEKFLDENLIDGQQRFTTLFLLLFFLALKEKKKNEFLSLVRYEELIGMSFDYKVRNLTSKFLNDFVKNISTFEHLSKISEQTWFLKDYETDVTIASMLNAIQIIQNEFDTGGKYYSYLLNYIVFWHFKTEATSQGEELYITMNARGEALASNEVAKATLMLNEKEVFEYGKDWENWQTFFWKKRNKLSKEPNADNGFNQFLFSVGNLENYLSFLIKRANEADVKFIPFQNPQQVFELLTLDAVKSYFIGFERIFSQKDSFKSIVKYSDWVDVCVNEIKHLINNINTNWHTDWTDSSKSTEQNRMVFLWSIFYFIKLKPDSDILIFFRAIRLFWLRYKGFDRSVTSIKATVEYVVNNSVWGESKQFFRKDEIAKHTFLNKCNINEQFTAEELIWRIEDHPLNIDSRDLDFQTITHLIDFDQHLTINELSNAKDRFFDLFPPANLNSNTNLLKSILLFSGKYWLEVKATNYKKYKFDEWKRIIRDKDSNTSVFCKFFRLKINLPDLSTYLDSLEDEFLQKNQEIISNAIFILPDKPFSEQLVFYLILLDDLWDEGEFIIVYETIIKSRLFKNEGNVIYNSKGTFHGYSGNTDLWNEANKRYNNNPLQELKNRVELICLTNTPKIT